MTKSFLNDPELRHGKPNMKLQIITVYEADSLDYMAVPQVQEIMNLYKEHQIAYEMYSKMAKANSDPALVIKAAQYGMGGDRYASEQYARNAANQSLQALTEMKPEITSLLNSVTPTQKNGVWVIEEYRHSSSEGTYYDYYLYRFSDAGELISQPQEISSVSPFDLINELIGQKYSSTQISLKSAED